MNPLLAEFVKEARDLLEQATEDLLLLERDPESAEVLNRIFRSVHTVKGASGLFESAAPLTGVAHAAEDLLDAAREQEVRIDATHVDLLLQALDLLARWIDVLERTGELPTDAEERGGELAGSLRVARGEESADAAPEAGAAVGFEPAWLSRIGEQARMELYHRAIRRGLSLVAVRYRPDPECFYRGDDPLLTVRQVPHLVALDITGREAWPALDELDPYRCELDLLLLSYAPPEELEHLLRYVGSECVLGVFPPIHLALPAGSPLEVPAESTSAAERCLDAADWPGLRSELERLSAGVDAGSHYASALRWCALVLDTPEPPPDPLRLLLGVAGSGETPQWRALAPLAAGRRPDAAAPLVVAPREREAALAIVEAQLRVLEIPHDGERWEGLLRGVYGTLRNLLDYLARDEDLEALEEALERALELRNADPLRDGLGRLLGALRQEDGARDDGTRDDGARDDGTGGKTDAAGGKAPPKALRIDQARIDRLMELIGEAVVAKNGLPFLARRAETLFGARELAREIKDHYGVIHRIVQEMQESIMQVRMLPVSQVFQRLPRLVRDLSRKQGKQIALHLEGEETEADKNILEQLSEPMIHLIRNAVDHGIEPPAERAAAGKPEEGMIALRASHEGESVTITIEDDGHGIDPERIKLKALARGLASEAELAAMPDQEAIRLIFHPGLSTAEQVSDISGRGVGMDVVRATIEGLGGRVELGSEPGRGTRIRLDLPMSMAVTRVLASRVGGQLFGIPMEQVQETVRVPPAAITRIKARDAFVLRDHIVPLVRLRALLKLPVAEADDDGRGLAVVVMQVAGEALGVVVDDLDESVEIILRPLEGVIAGIGGYSGTALLGDGRVMLVLNLEELLSCH
ncbi:chemotaxis protein CheA [Endothiovibrio diazotrophicus]